MNHYIMDTEFFTWKNKQFNPVGTNTGLEGTIRYPPKNLPSTWIFRNSGNPGKI